MEPKNHKVTIIGEERAGGRQAPFIRIRGDWLRDLGFEIGDTVEIVVRPSDHALIIKPVDPDPSDRSLRLVKRILGR